MNHRQIAGIAIVVLHALIVIPHGVAHSRLHIGMSLWQNLYILIVINLLPLLAALLIWKRPRTGFLILLFSMAGSLVFGVFYHFFVAGQDNVASLMPHPWTQTFQLTAILLALSETTGVVIGYLGLQSLRG